MIKQLVAAVLALCCVTAANAQVSTKIAVIDRQKAILETVAAKEQFKALVEDADFVANKKEYDAAVEQVRALYAKAQKEGPTMSQDQQAELAAKVQEKEADVKHAQSKLKAAEQKLARDILVESSNKMTAVIKKLIDAEGIGLLLPAEGVFYAAESYDITTRVTEMLNAEE